jgi:type I restriction enzyme S subunit
MSFDSIPLGDLLGDKGYIRGPFGSALKRSELKEAGIPVYEQQHAIRGDREFRYYIDEEKYNTLKRFTVESNDLIISCSGTVGRISIINEDDPKGIISQALLILRPNTEKVSSQFLYYFFTSKNGFNELINASQGAVQLNIAPRAVVEKILIPTPSLETQKIIVDILKSMDDKIALNSQINQTLESMAQAIFKSWFVDFGPVKAKIAAIEAGEDTKSINRAAMRVISGKSDAELDKMQVEQLEEYAQLKDTAELFPTAMKDSELGEVPEGWEVGCVGDITEKIFSGGTPNTKTEAFWNGELNWFSSGETRNLIIVDTDKRITEKGAKESSTKLAIYGDILIASAGQGHTRGQTSFCAIDTFINQSVISIRAKDLLLSSWLFFNLSRRYEEMRSISDSHSSRGSLTTKLLSGLSILMPPDSLSIEYGKIADQCLVIIAENMTHSNTLSQLRDTLLPKLLSGEVEVNAVNKAET